MSLKTVFFVLCFWGIENVLNLPKPIVEVWNAAILNFVWC